MTDKKKMNIEDLDKVVGGVIRTVNNTGGDFANVRIQPGIESEIVLQAMNGTTLDTTGATQKINGKTWYEVALDDEGTAYGWVAGHLIGYPDL